MMTRIPQLLMAMLLLVCTGASAQWTPTANLSVFSEDGAKFYLVLNGERYNNVAQTNIRIEELPNPYYNCIIIFEDKKLPNLSKKALMLTDADGVMQDVTYRIKRDNKGRNVLRFFSYVPAKQNMPRPANMATYRYGAPNMLVGTVAIRGGFSTNTTTNTTRSSGYHDNDYTDNRNPQSNGRKNMNSNRHGGCNMAMSNADYEDAKRTIANSSFDDTRLATAKQIAASNCLNTNQIVGMLQLFSFEASKLDYAKYAYDYCVDRNNYYKVSNAFTFESSKKELTNYVQGVR